MRPDIWDALVEVLSSACSDLFVLILVFGRFP